MSKHKPQRDLVDKRLDYAEGGVGEYWIVNPMERTITVLVLGKKGFRTHGVFGAGQQATSVAMAGFAVDVDEILA